MVLHLFFLSSGVNSIPPSLCLNSSYLLAAVLRGHDNLLSKVPLELGEFHFHKMSNAPSKILHRGHFKFDDLFDTVAIVRVGRAPSVLQSEHRSSCNRLVQRKQHMEM